MANSNLSSKLNRFLFFPETPPWASPSPSPSPSPFPSIEVSLLNTMLAQLKQWAFTAATSLRADVFFSLLQSQQVVVPVLGATKAGTIATLILITALFLLSLFFFPGPTLILLRWLAVSCFYICVFVFGLLWLICRGLFIAIQATFRCLLSELVVVRDYRPFSSTVRISRSSILPENRYQQDPGVRHYFVPPDNRSEPVSGVRQNRPTEAENRSEFGAGGKARPNSVNRSNIFRDREKMKETYEYRRAVEAEWAARQQELRRQAEEAQRQRSKSAEDKRAKANEKRQQKKRRTDQQNPETSRRRKEEETLDQSERIREDIRRKLKPLEKCGDMASLLRSLGIDLSPNPSQNRVRAAYREACKKFHPDRLATADLRHRIEAEEKFKLISAMKFS